jgi:hypothetical protein
MKTNKPPSPELTLAKKRLSASVRLIMVCLIIVISMVWLWEWNIFCWLISAFTLFEIKSLIHEWLTLIKLNDLQRASNENTISETGISCSDRMNYLSLNEDNLFGEISRDGDKFYEMQVTTNYGRQFTVRTLDNKKMVNAIRPAVEAILENPDRFYDLCIESTHVRNNYYQEYADELNSLEMTAVEFFSEDSPYVAEIIYSTNNPDRVWTSLWDGENFYDLSFDGHA